MNFSREVTPELQQGLYIFSNENWSCATNKPNQAWIQRQQFVCKYLCKKVKSIQIHERK